MEHGRVNEMNIDQIKDLIKNYKDFPQKGVIFRDISPILADSKAFGILIDKLSFLTKEIKYTKILAIDARGFIFGSALAYKDKKGLVMCRKINKLPGKLLIQKFEYEYDKGSLAIKKDSFLKNDRVLIVDDVLATGSTVLAAMKLIEKSGAQPVGIVTALELEYLNGRELLKKSYDKISIFSLIKIKK